ASGDGLLAGDLEDANVPGTVNVGAAAKLLGVEATRGLRVGDGDDADVVLRVFVAEEGQGSGIEGVLERGHIRLEFGVEANLLVDLLLDVAELFGVHGGEMGKVEAQAFGPVERAGLLDMRAKDVAQGGVDEVRARVIALDVFAAGGIGDDGDAVTDA